MTMPAPKMIPPMKLAPSKPPEAGGASVEIAVTVLASVIVVEADVVTVASVELDVLDSGAEVVSDVETVVALLVDVYIVWFSVVAVVVVVDIGFAVVVEFSSCKRLSVGVKPSVLPSYSANASLALISSNKPNITAEHFILT